MALIAAAVTSGALTALPTSGASAGGRLRPVTIYVYTAKVGVSGGESDSWASADPKSGYIGDSVANSSHGSFTIDGTVRQMAFWPASTPGGAGRSGIGYASVAVSGTWSSQGTKITGFANGAPLTAPYTCGGKIGPHVSPQAELSWKRRASQLNFLLHAVQQELYIQGGSNCANDDTAAWASGAQPIAYETTFAVPARNIGRQAFSVRVSGPLAKNRVYWHQGCRVGATCSLAWQGSVRFTLKRKYKTFLPG